MGHGMDRSVDRSMEQSMDQRRNRVWKPDNRIPGRSARRAGRQGWLPVVLVMVLLLLFTGCGMEDPLGEMVQVADRSAEAAGYLRSSLPLEELLPDTVQVFDATNRVYDLTELLPVEEGLQLWDWTVEEKGVLRLLYMNADRGEQVTLPENEDAYRLSVVRLDLITGERSYIVENREIEIPGEDHWLVYPQIVNPDPLVICVAGNGLIYDQSSDEITSLGLTGDRQIFRFLPQTDGRIFFQDYELKIYELCRKSRGFHTEFIWEPEEGCTFYDLFRVSGSLATFSATPLLDDRTLAVYMDVDLTTGKTVDTYTADYGDKCRADIFLNGYQIATDYGEYGVRQVMLRDTEGKCRQLEAEPEIDYLGNAVSVGAFALDDGCLFMKGYAGDGEHFLLWAFGRVAPSGEPEPEHVPYRVLRLDEVDLSAMEKEIEDAFGIEIHTGTDARLDFGDYLSEPQTDRQVIFASLAGLRRAYGNYPDGFFQQLNQTGTPLQIHLVKNLIGNGEGTVQEAGGIEFSDYTETYIAFAATDAAPDPETIYHETAHAIFDKLLADGYYSEFYEAWQDLNPEDFEYGSTYEENDLPDDTYTAVGNSEDTYENVYFIRNYSKTYETEDIADFMGNLMGDNEEVPAYFSGPHMQEKGKFFFRLIRKGFDTTGWPEKTAWEERLESVAP
ncbi:MAG: hypothetical protein IJM25_04150 [Eubacterium sp.]|nr:hypothetical protein [Eubacterium sp.]